MLRPMFGGTRGHRGHVLQIFGSLHVTYPIQSCRLSPVRVSPEDVSPFFACFLHPRQCGPKSIRYHGAKLLNALLVELRSAPSKILFKFCTW